MRGKNSTFTISSQDEEGMSSDETAIPPLPDGPEGMALFMQQSQAILDARKAEVQQKAEEVCGQWKRKYEELCRQKEQKEAILKAQLELSAEREALYEIMKMCFAEAKERVKQLEDQKTAQLKNTEKLIVELDHEHKETTAKAKAESESRRIGALKVLVKRFDDNLGTKLKRNKETGPGEYDVVDPSPFFMPLVEKFLQTKNITAFLCDTKEYAEVFLKNNE